MRLLQSSLQARCKKFSCRFGNSAFGICRQHRRTSSFQYCCARGCIQCKKFILTERMWWRRWQSDLSLSSRICVNTLYSAYFAEFLLSNYRRRHCPKGDGRNKRFQNRPHIRFRVTHFVEFYLKGIVSHFAY